MKADLIHADMLVSPEDFPPRLHLARRVARQWKTTHIHAAANKGRPTVDPNSLADGSDVPEAEDDFPLITSVSGSNGNLQRVEIGGELVPHRPAESVVHPGFAFPEHALQEKIHGLALPPLGNLHFPLIPGRPDMLVHSTQIPASGNANRTLRPLSITRLVGGAGQFDPIGQRLVLPHLLLTDNGWIQPKRPLALQGRYLSSDRGRPTQRRQQQDESMESDSCAGAARQAHLVAPPPEKPKADTTSLKT